MQHFQRPSHGRQCDVFYVRPGSHEKYAVLWKYALNPTKQQPQTGANCLIMHSTDRPCSGNMTPVNLDLRCFDQNTSNSAFHYSLEGFKLPDIKLPKFHGNPLEGNTWFELFQIAIVHNPKRTEVEKNCLQSICVDKAKTLCRATTRILYSIFKQ